jgi:hypothetical protein
MEDQNIYTHYCTTPKVTVSVERNTKGYNYSASVNGCETVEEAMKILMDAEIQLKTVYGQEKTLAN